MSEDLLRVTPPSDLVTEQNLLGGVLIQSELFPRVAAVVDGEDYYLEKHRRIFAAMHRLHAEGTEINGRAISDALRIAGDLKSIGGDDYLLLLTATPTRSNARGGVWENGAPTCACAGPGRGSR